MGSKKLDILERFAGEKVSIPEIAEVMDWKENETRTYLNRLMNEGKVTKTEEKKGRFVIYQIQTNETGFTLREELGQVIDLFKACVPIPDFFSKVKSMGVIPAISKLEQFLGEN